MSVSIARRKRLALYLSIAGLLVMVAAMSVVSARDPDGVSLRIGMIMVTIGAAMWLSWQALLPAAIAIWLGPNIGRNLVAEYALFNLNMVLELPAMLGVAAFAALARVSLRQLEQEQRLLVLRSDSVAGFDPKTGVYEESQLREAIDGELSRSRRFGRTFGLVLVGIDEMRQRFDYRDEATWQAGFAATAKLLRGTRQNVDRVYRYGPAGFALVLPESGPEDVIGLVRRLRRTAQKANPAEGQPGGPLPCHFGATFFPRSATTAEDLLRRAEIALRIADKNANRVQIDGAEAPEMAALETFRRVAEPVNESRPKITHSPASTAPLTETDVEPARPLLVVVPPETGAVPAAASTLERQDDGPRVAPRPDRSDTGVSAEEPQFRVNSPQALGPEGADGREVDEEPPFHVYALQAPEPAVDEYGPSWQAEAPLSVLPRPREPLRPSAADGAAASGPDASLHDSVDDALKRMDETLELIRSLKRRSA